MSEILPAALDHELIPMCSHDGKILMTRISMHYVQNISSPLLPFSHGSLGVPDEPLYLHLDEVRPPCPRHGFCLNQTHPPHSVRIQRPEKVAVTS